ncbi:MAG: ATP synthase F1 subunit delta [Lentimicrobium sp.]|nr:ATP synthase F1 subunit delta [Lentimicrobium sp.]
MNNPRVNIRYAQAVFGLAIERNEVESARKDMNLIEAVISENPGLMVMMKSPVINSDKKIAVIHKLFTGKIDKLAMGFVEIIIRKRREANLYHIVQKFEDLYLEYKNIRKAQVTSAVPLSESIRKTLKRLLEDQTKGTILLVEEVNPEIIGGLIVKVENQLFNDSIRHHLQALSKEFNINTYIREI